LTIYPQASADTYVILCHDGCDLRREVLRAVGGEMRDPNWKPDPAFRRKRPRKLTYEERKRADSMRRQREWAARKKKERERRKEKGAEATPEEQRAERRLADVREVAGLTEPITPGTPGWKHLIEVRQVQHPNQPIPDSIRWISKEQYSKTPENPSLWSLPESAAGAVVVFMTDRDHKLRALHIQAVTAEGEQADRHDGKRHRQTFGDRKEAWCVIREGDPRGPLVIGEGHLTVIAFEQLGLAPAGATLIARIAADYDEAVVQLAPGRPKVHILQDHDPTAKAAARKAARAALDAGAIPKRHSPTDPDKTGFDFLDQLNRELSAFDESGILPIELVWESFVASRPESPAGPATEAKTPQKRHAEDGSTNDMELRGQGSSQPANKEAEGPEPEPEAEPDRPVEPKPDRVDDDVGEEGGGDQWNTRVVVGLGEEPSHRRIPLNAALPDGFRELRATDDFHGFHGPSGAKRNPRIRRTAGKQYAPGESRIVVMPPIVAMNKTTGEPRYAGVLRIGVTEVVPDGYFDPRLKPELVESLRAEWQASQELDDVDNGDRYVRVADPAGNFFVVSTDKTLDKDIEVVQGPAPLKDFFTTLAAPPAPRLPATQDDDEYYQYEWMANPVPRWQWRADLKTWDPKQDAIEWWGKNQEVEPGRNTIAHDTPYPIGSRLAGEPFPDLEEDIRLNREAALRHTKRKTRKGRTRRKS